jgi:hypothetical protein
MHLADSADIVVGYVPSPRRYRVPPLNFDSHNGVGIMENEEL